LIEKIVNLIQNEDLRKEMGKKGKERLISQFSISQMIDNYWKIYKKLAG
jgi:glycosyltransferase involved in cell wall biosynthesis